MKKIIVLLLAIFMYLMGNSQAITQRGTSAVTVQDARLFAQYNFRPPAFQDTIAANLQIGLDSCGALIYSRDINAYYYRACNPKRWVKIISGNGIITANNGLTANTTSNVQLGGTLIQNTSILTNANTFTIERQANGNTINIVNSSSGTGNTKTALFASSTDGNAGEFEAGNTLVPNNEVQGILKLTRTTANPASPNYNEIGGAIDFLNPTVTGMISPTIPYTNRIASRWENSVSDPINGSYAKSRFELYGYDRNIKRNLAMVGDGKLILDQYGSGFFEGTPTYRLGVDENGNVIEDTTSGGGTIPSLQQVTNIGNATDKPLVINNSGILNLALDSFDVSNPSINKILDYGVSSFPTVSGFSIIDTIFNTANISSFGSNGGYKIGMDNNGSPFINFNGASAKELLIDNKSIYFNEGGTAGKISVVTGNPGELQIPYNASPKYIVTSVNGVDASSNGDVTITAGSGTVTDITQGYGIVASPTNPITTSGTIEVDTSTGGLSGKYLRISDTLNMLSAYVPYIGATSNVYLGTKSLYSNYIEADGALSVRDAAGGSNFIYMDYVGNKGRIALRSNSAFNFLISNASSNKNNYLPDSSGTLALSDYTVNSISRTPGKDSIIFYVGSTRYAIKDSTGGSGTVTSISQGYGITNSPNPITTTGTITVDTATLSNKYVPYVGATTDVNLDTHILNAQSLAVKGTNGNGHLDLRHQASNAVATGQTTALFADANGDLKWKNDGNYYTTLKTQQSADRVYTFQNKSYTLADSTDVAARVKYSDTASMLSPYLKKIDTASLSNRINLKLNISDTASMLSPYAKTNIVNAKLNISDTASMLSPYLRSNTASATYLAKSDSITYYTTYRSDTSRTNIYNALNGKFTLPSLTSGSVLFSNGTTISQDNSNFFWDNTNKRLGIGQSSPTSRFHLNFNQNSVTQSDANGILLANSTAAIAGTQSISPAIVWQGNGWKTTATAASQDVRFRADVLPVQGSTNATANWQLASSINGGAYSNTLTYNSNGLLNAPIIFAATQFTTGSAINSQKYSTTNGGTLITPSAFFGDPGSGAAGQYIGFGFDRSNGFILSSINSTGNPISRAGINIASLTNTAGSESGDLTFLTQSGGTAMSEKMRIFGGGNVAIGTATDNGSKLYVNGTGIFTNNLTVTSPGQISLTGGGSSLRFQIGNTTTYKTTSGGSGTFPQAIVIPNGNIAGNQGWLLDQANANGMIFTAGNGTDQIARAGINIASLTNTAGSESGDLTFLTQTGGTAMSEKMRISGIGNISMQQNLSVATQVKGGSTTLGAGTYRLINNGSGLTPQGYFGNPDVNTAGLLSIALDMVNNNGLIFIGPNGTANNRIARAGVNITNLNNTAGSESGDMIFLTQSGGTAMSEKMRITGGGGITLTATNTAAGTTGNQTINKPSGTVNIAAAGTTVTVTNSLVTASSIVFAVIRTNDATATIKNVVPAAGSFTINLNSAATAETSIGFFVIN